MTARRRLDRKARISIATAATLLLAGPVLVLRNCVSSAQEGNSVVASVLPGDDGLLRMKNGATVFLQHGSLSRKISAWLELDKKTKPAFEIEDTNFVAGSAEPSAEGWTHIAQVAQILEADPQLRAKIVLSDTNLDRSVERLEKARASRLYAELIEQQVSPSRVTSAIESAAAMSANHVINASGQESHLFVVLSG